MHTYVCMYVCIYVYSCLFMRKRPASKSPSQCWWGSKKQSLGPPKLGVSKPTVYKLYMRYIDLYVREIEEYLVIPVSRAGRSPKSEFTSDGASTAM